MIKSLQTVVDYIQNDCGVDKRHIRTQALTLRPIYKKRVNEYDGSVDADELELKPLGYTANRGLTITIGDIDSFDVISRGLLQRGVSAVDGVTFETTELRRHRDEARLLATRLAKEKARAMAHELGASLESVYTIEEVEENAHGGITFKQQARSAPASPDVGAGAGEIDITATVNVIFRLKPRDLSQEE